MNKTNEKIFNVPNFISFYRIVAFPFLIWMILTEKESLFAIFICINLVTDILDGFIARTFKLETQFGAKLDSLADIGTFICGFWGIIVFKLNEIGEDMLLLWIFLGLYILGTLISYIKFRQWPSLHLYSIKLGAYLQGTFFFVLFAWGYVPILYFLAIGFGCLSWIEESVVLLVLKKMKSNAKGIYWVLKEKNNK